ncbi:MAG TPA: alpha,alpha-trehalose-phosphate synthase (UDP-forming) [Rhodanobacteraceae bacterium]|nr:alpha,alpha-trehalose-phosphate synthase (UDP-forming) [Rhodanobacteraceae bacterium]
MSRLVVVSNRVALPKETRAGGLASALHAALAERGGLWFGWSGRIAATPSEQPKIERDGPISYALFDLTRQDYETYYLGFANRTLWPLFHFRPDLVDYSRRHLDGYLRVNRLFAERLARLLRPDDQVWVHDYHLIPLARELRALGVTARIGFFLHVPLPPPELLLTLPGHAALLDAFTAYDLVGFQIASDLRAFRGYLEHEMQATLDDAGTITAANGRTFCAGAFPISIDTALIARQAQAAMTQGATRRLIASLQGRALAIGVDRLDYSKGLPERFEAFGRFLSQHAGRRSQISFLQIAPPSREEVKEYRELRLHLEGVAGAINGRFAEPDWVPIRYVNRSFQQSTLAGFHRVAHIGLVTPLRDGMNLVAKEFVAAQAPDDPGVLVLSRFAGAALELRQAIIVNPWDVDDTAEGIERALAMSLAERRERWHTMYEYLQTHDITRWRNDFLAALADG